jgi:hypothetical protein
MIPFSPIYLIFAKAVLLGVPVQIEWLSFVHLSAAEASSNHHGETG